MLNLDGPELFTYNILDLLAQASCVLCAKNQARRDGTYLMWAKILALAWL